MRITLLIVFGAAGTLARYGLQEFVRHRAGTAFPTGTLIINIVGCLLLGGVAQFGLHHVSLPADWRVGIERWISWCVHYIFHVWAGNGAAIGRWRVDARGALRGLQCDWWIIGHCWRNANRGFDLVTTFDERLSMRKQFTVLLALTACALVIAGTRSASGAIRQSRRNIRLTRFVTRQCQVFPLAGLIPGAPADQKIDIAMVVWMIRGGGRTILFDSGFHRQKYFDQFHPIDFLSPDKAVQEAGVDPASVTDIIISHAHWEHMDGIDLFPAATIWIQKAEYEYYTGAAWQPGGRHGGIEPEDVQELVRRNIAGKVRLVDGDDKEIFPGIRAYTGAHGTLTLRNISEWEVIRHLYSRQIIVTCMKI